MQYNEAAFTPEQKHLLETQAVIEAQLKKLSGQSLERAQAIEMAQDEMLERVTYDMGGFASVQGFMDLTELSQLAQPLEEAAVAQRADDRAIRTLMRMQRSPYFARIDFRADGEKEAEKIYIGRATLMERETFTLYVYDWRTPIASVFYRYGTGPASYTAPAGDITGEVTLKRQYEIRDGELIYYFDADVQVNDAFLRELLSRPASAAMKSIVETIQRDQDEVIRDMQSDVLLVQGAAGSGKTSVALHRAAYLMYQGLSDKRLSRHEILILSPNAVFERYISNVLPELNEGQVQTALFDELVSDILPDTQLQSRGAWAEEMLSCFDAREKERMRFLRQCKGSRAFIALLDRFAQEVPRRMLPFSDVSYDLQTVMTEQKMRARILNTKRHSPLAVRLKWLENEIFERVHALWPARLDKLTALAAHNPVHMEEVKPVARAWSIRENGMLLNRVRQFTRMDVEKLYRLLFEDKDRFMRMGRGLFPDDVLDRLRDETLHGFEGSLLKYEDAVAAAYLKQRLFGLENYENMRQIVLDEAQDMDAMHIALMGILFKRARFTILGDVHQTLTEPKDLKLYGQIRDILAKPASTLIRLEKSFRCTREIWAFASAFLDTSAGECFSRSGAEPGVHQARNTDAMERMIMDTAQECLEQGHHSVAIITRTEKEALEAHARLKKKGELRLIQKDSAQDARGIFIMPLYVAKGMEFDAVLVYAADDAHYPDPSDKNLLYVACTRALHRLELFYHGRISPLIREKEAVS